MNNLLSLVLLVSSYVSRFSSPFHIDPEKSVNLPHLYYKNLIFIKRKAFHIEKI